ncbi:MAG: response regulator [Gemmatimonadota bacterium]|nr:MAG: response regulator [Gemmatimonadota bacterium]
MSTPSILVIDDDPDFVDVTKAILETGDYDVRCAYNLDEGLAMLEEKAPDLIVLDIMMRGMAEGLIFARKIRKDPRYSKIPILTLTSMRDQTGFYFIGEPVHSQFFPVDECVEKPLEPKALLEKVEQLLADKSDISE